MSCKFERIFFFFFFSFFGKFSFLQRKEKIFVNFRFHKEKKKVDWKVEEGQGETVTKGERERERTREQPRNRNAHLLLTSGCLRFIRNYRDVIYRLRSYFNRDFLPYATSFVSFSPRINVTRLIIFEIFSLMSNCRFKNCPIRN